ncbi:MIP2A, putative [Acanthamoeba castellanii str. Neff]|uniref:MIP2A, putative n=1 Tax=Acanthamoeba castellanii (strain ATCC 30010 / Neff) TaxID=1257118 RepID=L8H628_ACACF|nr:MIP2A, putative [Acanthamoeba castellanii str. Neff]ELR20672.1 MIP2A, putative [Acanthamoeba castellanii str. Neff]
MTMSLVGGAGYYYSFIIVGKRDNPLFEIEFAGPKKEVSQQPEAQFVIHAALDLVEEHVWKNPQMYLKVVDKYNDKYFISAFVTAGHERFMVLHNTKNEDGIKYFFQEVHELYIKVLLNPFYKADTPITSQVFQKRVKQLGRKYLT